MALLSLFAAVPFDQDVAVDNPDEFFRKEVMAFRLRGVSCGLWELYAAANVLHWNIQSVYPPLGQLLVQQHMNITVKPRAASDRSEAIMWTSNRSDMPPNYWVANHVVPLLHVVQGDHEAESPEVGTKKPKERGEIVVDSFYPVTWNGKRFICQVKALELEDSERAGMAKVQVRLRTK